ncbi:chemotaxis protein [Grimontia hollisae]|uniref:Chemotaxis protein n=1 Tax=Grimontia hollisae TaxID=673 RepID=A0A377HMJ7_GRIHO|nr:chemotaxis protein [Grimontia hollisae]STO57458.1 Uncharacterised protein [Grimontia hollisae]
MGRNKSNSSSDTTTTNNSGQNVIQGDNLGVSLSGINGNVGDITTTDHGAVEKSFEFAEATAELAMTANADVTGRALDSVDGAVDKAFAFGERSLESVDAIASTSIKQLGDKHSENLQMMAGLSGSQGQQNSENIKAMLQLAKMKTDGGASLADKRVLWVAGIGFGTLALLVLSKGK